MRVIIAGPSHSMEAPSSGFPTIVCVCDVLQLLVHLPGDEAPPDHDWERDPGAWMRNAEGKGRRHAEAREGARSARRASSFEFGIDLEADQGTHLARSVYVNVRCSCS